MTTNISTVNQLKKSLKEDANLLSEFKKDPVKALDEFAPSPLVTDVWIYRTVVGALGTAIVIILIGVVALMFNGQIDGDAKVPTLFTAVASGAIGALAGLLAPPPGRNQ